MTVNAVGTCGDTESPVLGQRKAESRRPQSEP